MQTWLPGTAPNSKAQREQRRRCQRKPKNTTIHIPDMDRETVAFLKRQAKAAGVSYTKHLRQIILAHVTRSRNPLR